MRIHGGRFNWRWGLAGMMLLGVVGLLVAVAGAQDKPAQEAAPAEEAGQTEPGQEAGEPTSPAQPDPEEIISRLKEERTPSVPIPPVREEVEKEEGATEFFQQVSPNVELEPLLPEGAYLVDRSGRLVKQGRWWTFVLEDRGEVVRSRPMRVLPSQLLETMEYASQDGTGDVVFVVSGEITEFHGVNYLLLRKVLIQRDLGNLGSSGGT